MRLRARVPDDYADDEVIFKGPSTAESTIRAIIVMRVRVNRASAATGNDALSPGSVSSARPANLRTWKAGGTKMDQSELQNTMRRQGAYHIYLSPCLLVRAENTGSPKGTFEVQTNYEDGFKPSLGEKECNTTS